MYYKNAFFVVACAALCARRGSGGLVIVGMLHSRLLGSKATVRLFRPPPPSNILTGKRMRQGNSSLEWSVSVLQYFSFNA